jgi:uncharacterized tellurite resistance protein B-like protein
MRYIKNILKSFISKEPADNFDINDQIQTATAVLFIELASADFNVSTEEQLHIVRSLRDFFDISEEEVQELLTSAKSYRDERNDVWLFTHMVKQNFSRPEKIKIIEMLWQLVYADGHMDKYEEAMMRKLSNLLGLSHGEMIQAKLKVKK